VVRCETCDGRGQLVETFESNVTSGGNCALVLLALAGGAAALCGVAVGVMA
jgi:hypothetical protein